MAISTPDTTLSSNDKRILNALFDPETLPSSVARSKDAASIDPTLPPHPKIPTSQLSILESQQNDLIRNISTHSDTTSLNAALSELTNIISAWPDYPSAYINRAMIQRMRIESRLETHQTLFSAPESETASLFTDLSTAINLSSPSPSSSSLVSSPPNGNENQNTPVPVSPYQARILKTAFSHRAYLYLKAAETGASLKGLGKSELEELASRDFAGAARYGDEVAREMSVRTNPYAKMCGAIVRNALREERKGEGL